MAAIGNLVHETTVTTGTGNITLAGASNGCQSFNNAFGTGGTDKFFYFISHQSAVEWEVGTGHLSAASTLVRDTVINSSNANAAVSFSAGTKDVMCDQGAASQWGGTAPRAVAAPCPLTSDLAALGSSSLMWSDLFLADSGVINWNNGAATLTGTTGQFAFDFGSSAGSLTLASSNAGATGCGFETNHNSASPASGDNITYWTMYGMDATAVVQPYAEINGFIADPAHATFSGKMALDVWSNTARLRVLQFTGALGLTTPTADGGGLGGWNDVLKIDLGGYTNYPSIEWHNNDPSLSYGITNNYIANHATAVSLGAFFETAWYAKNASGTLKAFAQQEAGTLDVTAGSEDGYIEWFAIKAGVSGSDRMGLGGGQGFTVTDNAALSSNWKGSGTINAQKGLYDKGYRIGEVLLANGTVVGSPTKIELALPTGYKSYRIQLRDVVSKHAASDWIMMRWGTGAGPTWKSGASSYFNGYGRIDVKAATSATAAYDGTRNHSYMWMTASIPANNDTTTYQCDSDIWIFNPYKSTSTVTLMRYDTKTFWNYIWGQGYGGSKFLAPVTHVRVSDYQGAGFKRLKYSLYGELG